MIFHRLCYVYMKIDIIAYLKKRGGGGENSRLPQGGWGLIEEGGKKDFSLIKINHA